MKTIISNKKIYIIILVFLFVIIFISLLLFSKTEAPKFYSGLLKSEQSPESKSMDLIPKVIDPEQKPINNIDEKYKIISRSVIMPINVLNKTKVILLTIDDGPGIRSLEMIKILNKHNAKAIFFVNGMHDNKNPGIISQISQAGFSVGNHTWNHLNLKKQTDLILIEKEINKNSELIKKETGNNPRFFRAPFGESNPYIRKLVKDNGMLFMDWSGAAMDWDKAAREKDIFISNVMNNVHSGSIILIHEHPWSLANLDALLTRLDIDGYTYVDPKNIIE
jgi:peptidoglycan/xylan/chitin deacetylase (PgdA/CDA1 family)